MTIISQKQDGALHTTAATHRSISQLVSQQAVRTPNGVAIMFKDTLLTYKQLDQWSNRIAENLLSNGVKKGDFVAVILDRCLELIPILLGILKAGAGYVPIDPKIPNQRREYILCDTQAALIIVENTSSHQNFGIDISVLSVNRITDILDEKTDISSFRDQSSSDDLMYVIYTSGTTGNPKGVMVAHRGVANAISYIVSLCQIASDDRVLQSAPLTFDASVLEIFLPLLAGGSVVLVEPGANQDPDYLVQLIAEKQVTTALFVPSMLEHIVSVAGVSNCLALRRIFSGGEALTKTLHDRFFKTVPASLFNLYGPTEASILVLAWPCSSDDGRTYVSLGRPVDNVELCVLNENGELVEDGVVGELHIGGKALAEGYMNNPILTQKKFRKLTLLEFSSETFYATGDLVRKHQDGTFEFVGRIDDQIKIRGLRIEPGEIEARLRELPQVRNALVVAEISDAPYSQKKLVAYLEAEAEEVTINLLRNHLAEHLPQYMIPSVFKVVQHFPLTNHTKLDKAQLLNLTSIKLSVASLSKDASNSIEQQLSDIWSKTLGLSEIGVDDDFFDLGGTSIDALIAVAHARGQGISLSPSDLFRLRKIVLLAQEVESRIAKSHKHVQSALSQ